LIRPNKIQKESMSYLKYTQYVYLVAAVFFTFKAVEIWNEENDQHFLFLGIAILSVFMFFFRRRFAKKFEDRNNKS
jgi:LPXTG-motif cell wall-anchored protein